MDSAEIQPQPTLTTEQKDIIRENWRDVEDNLSEVGLYMFSKLFTIGPELREIFPFDTTTDNVRLRMHATGVMKTVGKAVQNLDKFEELQPSLKKLGQFHHKKSIKFEHFQAVGQALIATLSDKLQEHFTPEVHQAWSTVFEIIVLTMKSGMN